MLILKNVKTIVKKNKYKIQNWSYFEDIMFSWAKSGRLGWAINFKSLVMWAVVGLALLLSFSPKHFQFRNHLEKMARLKSGHVFINGHLIK